VYTKLVVVDYSSSKAILTLVIEVGATSAISVTSTTSVTSITSLIASIKLGARGVIATSGKTGVCKAVGGYKVEGCRVFTFASILGRRLQSSVM
jgi:hypothetical protein